MPLLLHTKLSQVPEYAGICWWICGETGWTSQTHFLLLAQRPLHLNVAEKCHSCGWGHLEGFSPLLAGRGRENSRRLPQLRLTPPLPRSLSPRGLSLWQPQRSWTFCTMMGVSVSRETVTLSNLAWEAPQCHFRCILFIRAATRVSRLCGHVQSHSRNLGRFLIPYPCVVCFSLSGGLPRLRFLCEGLECHECLAVSLVLPQAPCSGLCQLYPDGSPSVLGNVTDLLP